MLCTRYFNLLLNFNPMKTIPAFTVAQLVEELKKFPPGLPVVTNGYEGEYENLIPPKVISVMFVPNQPWYDGQYRTSTPEEPAAMEAVAIEREVRPH